MQSNPNLISTTYLPLASIDLLVATGRVFLSGVFRYGGILSGPVCYIGLLTDWCSGQFIINDHFLAPWATTPFQTLFLFLCVTQFTLNILD